MSRDVTLFPTGIWHWPRCRTLTSDDMHSLINLWGGETSSIGVSQYRDSRAMDVKMSVDGYCAALANIQNRDLICMDLETGEIFVKDWFRIHKFKGVGKAIALREIDKIESESIRCSVLEAISKCPQCGLVIENQLLSSPTPTPTPTPTSTPTSTSKNSPAPSARNTPEREAQGALPPSAGECVEKFKKHNKWPLLYNRVDKSSKSHFCDHLAKLTVKGGGALNDGNVEAIITYLVKDGRDVIGALKGILKRGGWDPVRLVDAARPGETPAQAKNRLAGVGAHEHAPASDAAQPPTQENRGQDIDMITSAIKYNMRMYPRNPEFVMPECERLKELSPEHPLIQVFENHRRAAAAGDYKTQNKQGLGGSRLDS